jgi:hypothetical protein
LGPRARARIHEVFDDHHLFLVGLPEIVSILFRPVSLSFRLYGNIYAGENMLEATNLVPSLGWLIPVPLLYGTARRGGAGIGFHAFDGGVHFVDCTTRTGAGRGTPLDNFGGDRGSCGAAEATKKKKEKI